MRLVLLLGQALEKVVVHACARVGEGAEHPSSSPQPAAQPSSLSLHQTNQQTSAQPKGVPRKERTVEAAQAIAKALVGSGGEVLEQVLLVIRALAPLEAAAACLVAPAAADDGLTVAVVPGGGGQQWDVREVQCSVQLFAAEQGVSGQASRLQRRLQRNWLAMHRRSDRRSSTAARTRRARGGR